MEGHLDLRPGVPPYQPSCTGVEGYSAPYFPFSIPHTSTRAGTGKLELMKSSISDVVGLDWAVDMKVARDTLGHDVKVQGNVDPMILFGPVKVCGGGGREEGDQGAGRRGPEDPVRAGEGGGREGGEAGRGEEERGIQQVAAAG